MTGQAAGNTKVRKCRLTQPDRWFLMAETARPAGRSTSTAAELGGLGVGNSASGKRKPSHVAQRRHSNAALEPHLAFACALFRLFEISSSMFERHSQSLGDWKRQTTRQRVRARQYAEQLDKVASIPNKPVEIRAMMSARVRIAKGSNPMVMRQIAISAVALVVAIAVQGQFGQRTFYARVQCEVQCCQGSGHARWHEVERFPQGAVRSGCNSRTDAFGNTPGSNYAAAESDSGQAFCRAHTNCNRQRGISQRGIAPVW